MILNKNRQLGAKRLHIAAGVNVESEDDVEKYGRHC